MTLTKSIQTICITLAACLWTVACSETDGPQRDTNTVTVSKDFPLSEAEGSPVCGVRLNVACFSGSDSAAMIMNRHVAKMLFDIDCSDIRLAADSFANMCGHDYKRSLAAFYRQDKTDPSKRQWYEYRYSMTTEVSRKRKGYITYLADKTMFEGGSHEISLRLTANFNAETGHAVTTEELFVPGFKKRLSAILLDRLKEKTGAETLDDLHGEGYLLSTDMYPADNFILDDGGMTFIYNPYEIAPYDKGRIELYVRNDEIEDLLI